MLSKLQDAVQQVGGHAYVAERHNITMRSIIAIISSDQTLSEGKQLEIANQLIRNPANLVNASDLLKAITAVAKIHETREELYADALKVEDWITHTDLSDKERNRFTLAIKRIKLKYPQTFGTAATLRPKELDEALAEARKALSDQNGIKFTNLADVRRFGAACEVAYSMTADLSQSVGIQKVVEELEAHKALGALAERYFEYLAYLKELPRTEQAK